jgi:hypothetical protein
MEEIAWILRSDPPRKQVGFVRSSRLTDEKRYVLQEEWGGSYAGVEKGGVPGRRPSCIERPDGTMGCRPVSITRY